MGAESKKSATESKKLDQKAIETFLKDATETQKASWERETASIKDRCEEYRVVSGDTVGKIAARYGYPDPATLVALNHVLGKKFQPNEHSLHLKETLFVPKSSDKDPDAAKFVGERVVHLARLMVEAGMARDVARKDTAALARMTKHDTIYPERPQPLGLQDGLYALGNKAGEMKDARHARAIDVSEETKVFCMGLLSDLIQQLVDLGAMKPEEAREFLKKGKNAWMMPVILKKIYYEYVLGPDGKERFNFNKYIDPRRIPGYDPVDPRKREAYERELGDFFHTLSDPNSGLRPGGFIGLYYRRSREQHSSVEVYGTADPSKGHYITHAALDNGLWSPESPDPKFRKPAIAFYGWQQRKVTPGGLVSFGSDREGFEDRIEAFAKETEDERAKMRDIRARLDAMIAPSGSAAITQREDKLTGILSRHNGAATESVDGKERVDPDYLAYLVRALGDPDTAKAYGKYRDDYRRKKITAPGKDGKDVEINVGNKYLLKREDWEWLSSYALFRNRVYDAADKARDDLADPLAIEPLDPALANALKGIPEIAELVSGYGSDVDALKKAESELAERRRGLVAIERSNDPDKIRKSSEARNGIAELEKRRDALVAAVAGKRGNLALVTARVKNGPPSDATRSPAVRSALKTLFELTTAAGRESRPLPPKLPAILRPTPESEKLIAQYNALAKKLAASERDLSKEAKKLDVPEESVPLSDLIANYVQENHHLNGLPNPTPPYADAFRQEVLRNMAKYSELLRVKIRRADGTYEEVGYVENGPDGKPRLKSAATMPRVRPSDRVEFYGRMITDGVHFYQSESEDERKKMNTRVQPLAVAAFGGQFVFGDYLYPTPKSSLSPEKQEEIDRTTPAGELPFTSEWSILKIDAGKTFSQALVEEIKRYYKPTIRAMMKEGNRSEQSVLAELFDVQMTALKLSGRIDVRGDLTRRAANVNGFIPMYDMATSEQRHAIRERNRTYLAEVNARRLDDAREAAKYSDLIRLQIMPWDSHKIVSNRLADLAAIHGGKPEFKNLRFLRELPASAQEALLAFFFENATRLDEDELDKVDPVRRKAAARRKKPKEIHPKDIEAFFRNRQEGEKPKNPILPGDWYAMDAKTIDEAVKQITQAGRTKKAESFHPHENYVFERYAPGPWKNALMDVKGVESGLGAGDSGARLTVKYYLEGIFGKSGSDYQMRTQAISKGWNDPSQRESWPNKAQLASGLAKIDLADMRAFLLRQYPKDNGKMAEAVKNIPTRGILPEGIRVREHFEKDAAMIERLRGIVNASGPNSPEEIKEALAILKSVMRIGDGTGENVAGLALASLLAQNRLADVDTHLTGYLASIGEDPKTIYRPTDAASPENEARRERYRQFVGLGFNVGEGSTTLGSTQNFTLRLCERLGLSESCAALSGTVRAEGLLERAKGSLDYGSARYAEAMGAAVPALEKETARFPAGSNERLLAEHVIAHAKTVGQRYAEYSLTTKNTPQRRAIITARLDALDKKTGTTYGAYLLDRDTKSIWTAEDIDRPRDPTAVSDPVARAEYEALRKLLADPTTPIPGADVALSSTIRQAAHDFMADKAFRARLWRLADFDPSLIPLQAEIDGGSAYSPGRSIPFRASFLNYAKKMREDTAPGKILSLPELAVEGAIWAWSNLLPSWPAAKTPPVRQDAPPKPAPVAPDGSNLVASTPIDRKNAVR